MSNNIKNKRFSRKKRRKHNKDKSRKHKQKKHRTKKQKGGLVNTSKILYNFVTGKKSNESDESKKSNESDESKKSDESLKKGFWAGLGSNPNDSKEKKIKNLAYDIFLRY